MSMEEQKMETIAEIKLEILRYFDKREAKINGTKVRRLVSYNGKQGYVIRKKISERTIHNLTLLEVGHWFRKMTALPHYHTPYSGEPFYGPFAYDRYIHLVARLKLRHFFLNEDTQSEIRELKAQYVFDETMKGKSLNLGEIEYTSNRYCGGIRTALKLFRKSHYQAFIDYPVTVDIDKYKKEDKVEFVFLTNNILFISFLYSGPRSIGHDHYREKMKLLAIGLMNKFGKRDKVFIYYSRYYLGWCPFIEEYSGEKLYSWFSQKVKEMKDITETGKIYVNYSNVNYDNPNFDFEDESDEDVD